MISLYIYIYILRKNRDVGGNHLELFREKLFNSYEIFILKAIITVPVVMKTENRHTELLIPNLVLKAVRGSMTPNKIVL